MKHQPQEHYTPYQLKLPVEIGKIIEIFDPVYSFCEAIDRIDLNKYLTVEERRVEAGLRYDEETLLKIILFAFMENGYASVRNIEKYCKTDIRYMWLLQDNSPPSPFDDSQFYERKLYRYHACQRFPKLVVSRLIRIGVIILCTGSAI